MGKMGFMLAGMHFPSGAVTAFNLSAVYTYFRQVCGVVCKCKLSFKNIKAEQNITKWLPHRVLQLAKFFFLDP